VAGRSGATSLRCVGTDAKAAEQITAAGKKGTAEAAGVGARPVPAGPPWPVAEGVDGAARGKTLNPPNARHTVAGARSGMVRPDNSVVLRGNEDAMRDDVAQIAAGNARWNPATNRYEINGRSYGVETNGTVFPDSGPGIVKLDRNEYAALIREHPVPTPVTDELAAWLADEDVVLPEGSQDAVRQARVYLTAWEQLTERMAAGWPPDGWYPADYYREDLANRDKLDTLITQLPAVATGRFRWAIGRIDEKFKTLTHETTAPSVPGGAAWWWRRVPDKPGRASP